MAASNDRHGPIPRKKILLAASEPDHCRFEREMLRRVGHTVITTSQMAEVTQLARAEQVDLVIVDFYAPTDARSGCRAVEALRADASLAQLPVILLFPSHANAQYHPRNWCPYLPMPAPTFARRPIRWNFGRWSMTPAPVITLNCGKGQWSTDRGTGPRSSRSPAGRAPLSITSGASALRPPGSGSEMHKLTNDRRKWGMSALLTGTLLGGCLLLSAPYWPYWEAKCGWMTRFTNDEMVLHGADLHGASLRGAYLPGADLSQADLYSADLSGADLGVLDFTETPADLQGADLRNAYLRGAGLAGACLRSANLRGADLSGADLCGADLSGADLRDARLAGANLMHVEPMDTELNGADLRGANLDGVRLAEAHYDARTRWPSGFDPVKHGAILVR